VSPPTGLGKTRKLRLAAWGGRKFKTKGTRLIHGGGRKDRVLPKSQREKGSVRTDGGGRDYWLAGRRFRQAEHQGTAKRSGKG